MRLTTLVLSGALAMAPAGWALAASVSLPSPEARLSASVPTAFAKWKSKPHRGRHLGWTRGKHKGWYKQASRGRARHPGTPVLIRFH